MGAIFAGLAVYSFASSAPRQIKEYLLEREKLKGGGHSGVDTPRPGGNESNPPADEAGGKSWWQVWR